MNNEEKARAYDKALNWMRAIYPNLSGADKEDAEHFFPELRESEDERIRKWILEKMQGYASSGIPCSDEIKMADKAIDYLEKQKEQKLESCDCSRDEESYINGIHHVLMNPEAYGLIKQKPAEWSEENEVMLKEIVSFFKDGSVKLQHDLDLYAAFLEKRLKSLRSHPKPSDTWKPSEDEERLIKTSISFLKDFADKGYENAVECIDWLKSKLNGDACK